MTEFTNEQISRAYDSAPKTVQDFLENGELGMFITSTAATFSLSLEARRTLATLARNALLRLITPSEFEVGISQLSVTPSTKAAIVQNFKSSVNAIMTMAEPKQQAQSTPLPTPVPPDHLLPPSTTEAATLSPHISRKQPLPEEEPRKVSAQQISHATPAQIIDPGRPRASEPVRVQARFVPPRTMASDVEAMQGQKRREKVAPRPVAPQGPQVSPAQKQRPAPAVAAVHEDLKKYGIDPYREPIE